MEQYSGPLKGVKGSTYEGGMRMPTVVRWPASIPAGKDNQELITTMDLLPTFARLAGAEVPNDRVIDGRDIYTSLTKYSPSPYEALFYHSGKKLLAMRSGKWKLHLGSNRNKHSKVRALSNLELDLGETSNLIKNNQEVEKNYKT